MNGRDDEQVTRPEPAPAGDAGAGPAGPAPAGPGDAGDASAEERQLEADLAQLQREREEALDTARRIQADFENYRKRMVREQTAHIERATEGLVEQLLPVLDSFELAVQNVMSPDADLDKVRKGIELVYAELFAVLEKAGLQRIEALGAPFDPNEHDAVMQDEGDGDPIVGEVLRAGWKLKGRVLRPAMVKVTRA
ncbi:MAG: nucleotide exchange factor GrpE [Acidimicrobiia bacterium]|nr:MAG: nucleotide exchange factor GrpE [Acidimicrobiia bacterium]